MDTRKVAIKKIFMEKKFFISLIIVVFFLILLTTGGRLDSMVKDVFSDHKTSAYIWLGVLGSIVCFLNQLIKDDDGGGSIFIERVMVAVIISFVIGIVFFSSQNNKGSGTVEVQFSLDLPYLVCFVAGYSYEVVESLLRAMVNNGLDWISNFDQKSKKGEQKVDVNIEVDGQAKNVGDDIAAETQPEIAGAEIGAEAQPENVGEDIGKDAMAGKNKKKP